MTLGDIGFLIQYAVLPWLLLFFAVIAIQILRGDINTTGLLRTRSGSRGIDPERVAILGTTLFAAGSYLVSALHQGAVFVEATHSYRMPDIPDALLVVLGGSNGIYLGGKIARKTQGDDRS